MRSWFLVLALALSASAGAEVIAPTIPEAIAERATELVAGTKDAVDGIAALHAWVRDEVAECKTRYG